jgi:tRNA nucleotidyltransferase (CCA-adding enzyme)
LFPPSTGWEELESAGLEVGKKVLDEWELKYAEHPCVHGKISGYETDIVPCHKVKSATGILSAFDRTPLHTTYIKQKLKGTELNQVRLLKQFLKGTSAYGAGDNVNGFSGYLCEILILKYGNFLGLLKQAMGWKENERIILEGSSKAEFDPPLVVIDPVDLNRNVAASVSRENFELFRKAAKAYLEQPGLKFFFPPKKPLRFNRS